MELIPEIGMIALCVLLSAFFSGSETALLRLRSHQIERDIQTAAGPAAVAARSLVAHTSRLLVTILMGNNVVNILGTSLASALAIQYLGEQRGILVATVTMTLTILIFAEILPKAFAARNPRQVSYAVALPLYIIHGLMRPVHWVFDRVIEPIVQRVSGGEETSGAIAEEVLELARKIQAEHAPGTPSTPVAIIGGVARAIERTCEEIMVPRPEIFAVPEETDPNVLLDEMLGERYTRVPVYRATIDRILGVVHLKDLIEKIRKGEPFELRAALKPVLVVPERKPVLELLADMQREFAPLAVVKNEFGVTMGLVSQEDVLEEIVGEIRDEFDWEELENITRLTKDTYKAEAHITVLDFNRQTGWEVPAERGDTLGGLVFNTLGRTPRRGDVVRIPGFELAVVGVSGNRITEVRIRRLRPGEESGESVVTAGR